MLNPGLTEMVARDRIRELQRTSARRASRTQCSVSTELAAPRASTRRRQHGRLASSQRAIGWLLVSIGLRLVVPRTRTGSVR